MQEVDEPAPAGLRWAATAQVAAFPVFTIVLWLDGYGHWTTPLVWTLLFLFVSRGLYKLALQVVSNKTVQNVAGFLSIATYLFIVILLAFLPGNWWIVSVACVAVVCTALGWLGLRRTVIEREVTRTHIEEE